MPYYNLKVLRDGRILSSPAGSLEHALAVFGEELGVRLAVNIENEQPNYLLDEWFEYQAPHWVNPHIPVFDIAD